MYGLGSLCVIPPIALICERYIVWSLYCHYPAEDEIKQIGLHTQDTPLIDIMRCNADVSGNRSVTDGEYIHSQLKIVDCRNNK